MILGFVLCNIDNEDISSFSGVQLVEDWIFICLLFLVDIQFVCSSGLFVQELVPFFESWNICLFIEPISLLIDFATIELHSGAEDLWKNQYFVSMVSSPHINDLPVMIVLLSLWLGLF